MNEALYIPEHHLSKVIEIIRIGLQHTRPVPREVREQLLKWCREEEDYVRRMAEDK